MTHARTGLCGTLHIDMPVVYGRQVVLPVLVRLSDGEALVQAAMDGLGLVQVPSYIAAPAVERGRLVEILKG
ncbi:hypothetical protein [Thiohalocapsa sp.]|uniref:hypothetical protein n=1 Tax=Thiohalocapsa sp. TaxID=2497641 RepID=UPI0025CC1257|nr:hypothetical protein [Thiohalocapsa sp.]